ncbi:MAG: PDZ domain-containing protein [Myxococcaceae bacterium]
MKSAWVAALVCAGCATTGSGGWGGASLDDGRERLAKGELARAVTALREAHDGDPKADADYGYALAMLGLYEPALSTLERAIERDPKDPGPYATAGWVFFFAGFPDVSRDLWSVAAGEDEELQRKARAALDGFNTVGVATWGTLDGERRRQLEYSGDSGAVVTSVYPGPPAVRGVLRPGDVVIGVDAGKITSPADIEEVLRRATPGHTLAVVLWRKGSIVSVRVPVLSSRPLEAARAADRAAPPPTQALLDRLDWADHLFLERHPLQAALAYRQIIDRYPGWYLPYPNYSMALEEVGAYSSATAAMRQAVALAPPDADEELKDTLHERLEALEKIAPESPSTWREEQQLGGGLIDADNSVLPSGTHLGFAGGSIAFADKVTGSGTVRIGQLFSFGLDASVFVTLEAPGGVSLGASIFQRLYVPRATRRMSFNVGAHAGLSVAGAPSLGPMVGMSFFTGDKRDRSIDLFLEAKALSSPMEVTGSLGVTRFFGN